MDTPSIYAAKVSESVRSIELNFDPSLVIEVLFMVRRTPSPMYFASSFSFHFTMFSPLLPRNTLSAMTYGPIFNSTVGFVILDDSEALLPPQ